MTNQSVRTSNERTLSFGSFSKRLVVAGITMALITGAVRADDDDDDSFCPHGGLEAFIHLHTHPWQPDLSTGPVGYSAAQMRHAYGIDQLAGNGAGQIIAVIDAYGSKTIQNDLNVFSAACGLPATTVQVLYPLGLPTTTNSLWALESTLDVEWAHAIAPGATIMLVVVPSATFANLIAGVDAAVKAGARQVSMSWGSGESSSQTTLDAHFNKAGITFIASSGDSGASVQWPASSPYVTAVGGTTLTLNASGSIVSETAWSGSGGGISKYELRPAYQKNWQSSKFRTIPDVAYNGDPNTGVAVYISNYNGGSGWQSVGGTSAGAPQWAAMIALANSNRLNPLNGTDLAIYSLAGAGYSKVFHDITVGSDGTYHAAVGYDYLTGLGSPIANVLIGSLRLY